MSLGLNVFTWHTLVQQCVGCREGEKEKAVLLRAVGCGLRAVGCGLWAVGCGLWAVCSVLPTVLGSTIGSDFGSVLGSFMRRNSSQSEHQTLGDGHRASLPGSSTPGTRHTSVASTTMRTRSRLEGGGETAEAAAPPASPPPQSPRSTKKRKAATSTPPAAAADTPKASKSTPSRAKKSKPEVPASAAAATPSSGARAKALETKSAADLEASQKAPRSKAGKQAAKASPKTKAAEGQSSLILSDGVSSTSSEGVTDAVKGEGAVGAMAAPAGSVPAAPKGRCVSGRDWKVRNQSQR